MGEEKSLAPGSHMLGKNGAGLKCQAYVPLEVQFPSISLELQIQACPVHWDGNPWGWLERSQVDTDVTLFGVTWWEYVI